MPVRGSFACRAAVALGICLITAGGNQPEPTPENRTQAALSELRGALLVAITDKGRAQEAVALVDQIQEQDSDARNAVAGYRQRLLTLDANYDATEGDFKKLFADFNSERLMRQSRFVQLWLRMASLMTDAEWRELDKARVAAARAVTAPQ